MSGTSNSFDRAKDERELSDALWLLAVAEAYRANDARRRLAEMQNLTRTGLVDAYLKENPEIGRWVHGHIEAGTCASGAADLRAKMAEFSRAQQANHSPKAPEPDDGEMRAVQRTDPATGYQITEFHGGPSIYKLFGLPPVQIAPIWPETSGEERAGGNKDAPALTQTDPADILMPSDKTGAPGGPSSMHLIEIEMRRRAKSDEMITTTIKAEAEVLAKWLRTAHPTLRPATPKTIQNHLGGLHRRLKGSQN